MKDIPGFKGYFVSDLMKRAAKTLTDSLTAFENEPAKLKSYMKQLKDAKTLDPLVLIFLREQVFELGYIENCQKKPEVVKAFFDIFLSYTVVFLDDEDY